LPICRRHRRSRRKNSCLAGPSSRLVGRPPIPNTEGQVSVPPRQADPSCFARELLVSHRIVRNQAFRGIN
jgi:hypothetical protein